MFTDTPRGRIARHPIIDYNYVFADPVLGGELSWNTNALSFSSDRMPTDYPSVGGKSR